MTKPIAFFSHSSKDQAALVRLKAAFVKMTGGSIDVFLSSDGQSIPLGRNWVHKVEEALGQAGLMMVFVTPASTRSSWLYFESGYAYSKGVRVVPVGFLGTDLSTVPAPLSLLQGFNVNSKEGLNNIIAVVNEEFGHKHAEAFSVAEYEEICSEGGGTDAASLGAYASLVDQISLHLKPEKDFQGDAPAVLVGLHSVFAGISIDCQLASGRLDAPGIAVIVVKAHAKAPGAVDVDVEGSAADFALPTLERGLREVCLDGLKGRTLVLEFVKDVTVLEEHHQQSGRLIGTGVRLAGGERLGYRDLVLQIMRRRQFAGSRFVPGRAVVAVTLQTDSMALDQIREVIEMLFERRVLIAD